MCRNCLSTTHSANQLKASQAKQSKRTQDGVVEGTLSQSFTKLTDDQEKCVTSLICGVKHQSLGEISHKLSGTWREGQKTQITHTVKFIQAKESVLLLKKKTRQDKSPCLKLSTPHHCRRRRRRQVSAPEALYRPPGAPLTLSASFIKESGVGIRYRLTWGWKSSVQCLGSVFCSLVNHMKLLLAVFFNYFLKNQATSLETHKLGKSTH